MTSRTAGSAIVEAEIAKSVLAARARLRVNDHVMRMGGDEFLLVLRQIDLRTAHRICAEIVEAWKETSADVLPSASFGLAQVGAGSFEQAMAHADERMYESKSRVGAAPGGT